MTTEDLARDTFEVFGTTGVLLVTDPGTLAGARAIAERELAAVDLAASRFRPDSEISRVNEAGGKPTAVSALLAELVAVALRAAELTGGDVDPVCGAALIAAGYDRDFAELRSSSPLAGSGGPAALPPLAAMAPARRRDWRAVQLDQARRTIRLAPGVRLDLGATAKAWAADRCARLIAERHGCGVLVSLGGDISVAGPAPPDGWRVRVTDDHAAPASAPGQTVSVRSGGLATSSTTVRAWTAGGRARHHIIDPATGESARSCWRTVSVAAGSCVDANIASTASIVRAEAAPGWLTAAGLPARLVRPGGEVITTAGWPAD